MTKATDLNDLDRRIWEDELEDFVPEQLFDAHVHVYDPSHCFAKEEDTPTEYMSWWDRPIPYMDRAALDDYYSNLFPGRTVSYLMMGYPFINGDLDAANRFTARQAATDPKSAALMLVRPDFSAEYVAQAIDEHGFRGLKPYRWYAADADNCGIMDFLPEHLIEVADDRELAVTLHLSKKYAIADEDNLNDLAYLTKRYPKVRWVLAHMARCLVPWPLERAMDRLKEMPGIWLDFSSVTISDVFALALKNLPTDRIMYGSDLPIGVQRGQYVGFGYAWALLDEKRMSVLELAHCDGRPTFIGYETLRAVRRAILAQGLGRKETEDIFCNNALKLLGSG